MNEDYIKNKEFAKAMELAITVNINKIDHVNKKLNAIKIIERKLKKTTKALYKHYEEKLEVWKTVATDDNNKEEWSKVQKAIDKFHEYNNVLRVVKNIKQELKYDLSAEVEESIRELKDNIGLNANT